MTAERFAKAQKLNGNHCRHRSPITPICTRRMDKNVTVAEVTYAKQQRG